MKWRFKKWADTSRLWRFLVYLLSIWAIVFLSGFLLILNPSVRQYLKSRIITTVEKNLDGTLKIGDISGNPFSTLRLTNIELIGPFKTEAPQNRLTADEVTVRFSLWQLLQGNIGFWSIKVNRPVAYLDTKVFMKHRPDTGKKAHRTFNLNWLDLQDGKMTLVYFDKPYRLENVDLTGSFSMDTNVTNIRLRNFTGLIDGLKVDHLGGRVSFSPGGIVLKTVRLSGREIQLDLDGNIRLIEQTNPQVEIHIKSDRLPVEKVLGLIPRLHTTPATGIAKFKIDLEGPLNRISGQGYLKSTNGTIGKAPFKNLFVQFNVVTSYVKVQDASIEIFKGKIKMSGDTRYVSQFEPMVLSKNTSNLSVDTTPARLKIQLPYHVNLILQAIDLTQIPKIDPKLSGILDVNLKLSGDWLKIASYNGEGNLLWNKGTYHGVENLSGKSDISVKGDHILFPNTHFQAPEVEAKGTIDLLRMAQKNARIEFKFDWNARDVARVKSIINLEDITGIGRGQVHGLSDNFAPIQIDGKFQLDNGRFSTIQFAHVDGTIYADRRLDLLGSKLIWMNDWPVDKADIQIRMGDKNNPRITALNFTKLDLQQGKTRVLGSGIVDFNARQYKFTYASEQGRLVDLPGVKKFIPMFEGNLEVKGTVNGWGDNIVVTNRYVLKTPEVWKGHFPGDIQGNVNIDNRYVNFSADGAGYHLQGNVDYKKPDPYTTVNGQLNNARWFSLNSKNITGDMSGALNGNFQVAGKASNLTVSGKMESSEIRIGKQLDVRILPGVISGQVTNNMQFGTVNIQSQRVDIPANQNIEAAQFYNPLIQVTWNSSKNLNLNLSAGSGKYGSMPLNKALLQFDFQETRTEIKDLLMTTTAAGSFNLKGYWDYSGDQTRFRANVVALNLPAESFLRFSGSTALAGVNGSMDLRASVDSQDLEWNKTLSDGTLAIRDLHWNNTAKTGFASRLKLAQVKQLTGKFKLQQGKLQFPDARLAFSRSTVNINGSYGPGDDIKIKFDGTLEHLGDILEDSEGSAVIVLTVTHTMENPSFSGTIQLGAAKYDMFRCQSGTIQVNMNDKMQGDLKGKFDKFAIGAEVFDQAEAAVVFKDPQVIIKSAELIRKETKANLDGSINTLNGDINLNMDAQNIMLMRWLMDKPLIWMVDSELNVQSRFKGNFKNRSGILDINRLSGISGRSSLKLENPSRIEWQGDTWTIKPFTLVTFLQEKKESKNKGKTTGDSGNGLVSLSGKLTGNGSIRIGNPKQYGYNFNFNATQFAWPIVKGTDAIYDTQINLKDVDGRPKISGNVKILRIFVNAPLFLENAPKTGPGKVVSLPELPLHLDITISADSAVFLRHELLDLEARGWTQLKTNASRELEITHELKAIGGSIIFRGKKFPITKAEVRHTDPKIFNPYIEAQAQTKLRNIDIFLRVFGTLNNYDISLSSDPPYPQTDIFALLATGRTVAELQSLGQEKLTSEIALGYASEELLNTLGNPFMKAVGIDNIYTEYDEIDNEAKLKVQKNINKKLSAGYSLGLSKESNSNAQVDFKINKKLSVVGRLGVNSLNKEASGSVDLEFRIPTK